MRLTYCLCVLFLPSLVCADGWLPPDNPKPSTILQEAKIDHRDGNYEAALAKHLWYHDNALAIEPAQLGVRLSFALSAWLKLGEDYPTAMKALVKTREDTEAKIRAEDQVRVKFRDFHDYTALNRTLGEEKRTVDLFVWISEKSKKDATRMLGIARPALIKAQRFDVFEKIIDPEKDVVRLCKKYETDMKRVVWLGERHRDYAEKSFLFEAATLVAILAKNKRLDEAREASTAFRAATKDSKLDKKMESELLSAMSGKVPTRQ